MSVDRVTAAPSQAPDHELRIDYTYRRERGQRVDYLIPGMSPGVEYSAFENNVVNLRNAILERVFYVRDPVRPLQFMPPPEPLRSTVYEERLAGFRLGVTSYVRHSNPISRDEFPLMYQARKRTVYENAVASLLAEGVSRRDARVKVFVKSEKGLNLASGGKVPRVISPRDPRYNVEVGRYLKPLEPRLISAVSRVFRQRTIMKGCNAHQIALDFSEKWALYDDPVAVSVDASRFDQHVSVPALRWEHSLYLRCFDDQDELAELLSWQLRTEGVGYLPEGKIQYSVHGRRMSGDMNTSLGNCLIMCGLIHAYCRSRGLRAYSLSNNGDDSVIIVERRDLDRLTRGFAGWFLEMGFTMVCEDPVDRLEEVSFCQAQPVFDGGRWVMVRHVPTSLGKDALSLKPLTDEMTYRRWLKAVGDSGLALAGGIPIVDSYYRCLLRAAGAVRPIPETDPQMETGMAILARGMDRQGLTVSDEARVSFYLAFGVTPEGQVEMERYYNSHCPKWRGIGGRGARFSPFWTGNSLE